ncbi:MAG: DUF4263 domain-containing protein [Fimbriimonadaceae bacterium]|nr:DUF4263 domain-containing protein [Fimbriimonadaceae bacterium]
MVLSFADETDFVVGEDDFENLEIADAGRDTFYYFKNTKKSLVKHFVLKRTARIQKQCAVTLIKSPEGIFEPRFEFEIVHRTKRTVGLVETPVLAGETRAIKARVDFRDCHENFSRLLRFVSEFDGVVLTGSALAVVSAEEKKTLSKLLNALGKEAAMAQFAEAFKGEITERDVALIAGRKKSLTNFKRLLDDPGYFAKCKEKYGPRDEDVWQKFFEANTWIFGYGLQLVACEGLKDHKLETIVVGNDMFDGAGKRTDALLKTKGRVSNAIFCEIKTHLTPLVKNYDRPGVFVPGEDLQGAIGQVQKTLHKVSLKLGQAFKKIADKEGNPSGEDIAFVQPKGLIVIGQLDQFVTKHGVNEEQFSSFELFRRQISGIEIITFDELYERTRFIVDDLA